MLCVTWMLETGFWALIRLRFDHCGETIRRHLMSNGFSFCDISSDWCSLTRFVNSLELQNGDILILSDLLHLLIGILYKETLSLIYYLVAATVWLPFGAVRKYNAWIFFCFFSSPLPPPPFPLHSFKINFIKFIEVTVPEFWSS